MLFVLTMSLQFVLKRQTYHEEHEGREENGYTIYSFCSSLLSAVLPGLFPAPLTMRIISLQLFQVRDRFCDGGIIEIQYLLVLLGKVGPIRQVGSVRASLIGKIDPVG